MVGRVVEARVSISKTFETMLGNLKWRLPSTGISEGI